MTAWMSSRLGICLPQYVHRLAGWLKHCSVPLPLYLTSTAQSTNLSRKHKAAQSAGGRWVDAAERQLCDVARRLLGPYAPPNMEPEHQTRASDPRF